MSSEFAIFYEGAAPEATPSAVAWPAIIAGAVGAMAITLILMPLGAGFGVAALSPWPAMHADTFSVMAGVWVILTQWISSAFGGYLTGRLRTRWASTHTHEVFFRDTAHGFLTWGLATLVVAILAALAATAGAHAAAAAAPAVDVSPAAAEAARKAASATAIFTGLSMLVGAFVASVAAALGGQQRDEHP